MKTFLKSKKSIILVFTLTCSASLMAITPPPPGLNPGVPLDGGIAALILGAAAYGIKKLRDNRKA